LRKPESTPHFGLIGPSLSNFTKVLIVGVGGSPGPVNDLPLRGHQPTEFDPNNPAMITDPFLAHLCGTAPFPNRVNQLNARLYPSPSLLAERPKTHRSSVHRLKASATGANIAASWETNATNLL
jgi:hypothetical protein